MPSDLLNTGYGADALREAVCDQIRRRMRRWFKRNTVVAFDEWVSTNKAIDFDFSTVLGQLNVEHDQEIYDLYELLKNLELGYATVNSNFYVDTVNGNDQEGDGSIDAPFSSLTRIFNLLPKKINGYVNIFLNAPVGNPIVAIPHLDIDFGPRGQLTVQGATTPTVVSSPHTATNVVNVGVAMTYAHEITDGGAAWVPNAMVGYFVHVTSGANAGALYVIERNTATQLYVPYTGNILGIGDNFSIITPSDFIDLTADDWSGTFNADLFPQNGRFILANLDFSVDYCELGGRGSVSFNFPFCRLNNVKITGNDVHINEFDPYSATQLGWADLRDLNPYTYIEFTHNWCLNTHLQNTYTDYLYNWRGHLGVQYVGWQQYQSHNASDNRIDQCYCYGAGDTIELYDFDTMKIDGLWVEQAINCIDIHQGQVHATSLEGNGATITGYTVIMGGISGFQFNGVPVSGLTNDVNWNVIAAGAAFPGVAGTGISDLVGSWVVKLS